MSTPVTLVGRLGGDPELRFTPQGKAVASFSVATEARRKNETTNEWESYDTTWWRCTAWEQMGENVAETLRRGDEVIVTGKALQREYEQNGEKRRSLEVKVDAVGPTLKYATAVLTRTSRSSGQQRSQPQTQRAAASGRPAADDPWATAPSGGGGWSDEAPF